MGHSPTHRQHHHLSDHDLGHFDAEAFIKACDFQNQFMGQCFDFDIPYGGGISVCGKWYFQDHSIPRYFYDGGAEYVPTDSPSDPIGKPCWYLPRFWMVHEKTEFHDEVDAGARRRDWVSQRYMETRDRQFVIGSEAHFDYEPCHQIAEGTEERLVVALGLDLPRYVRMCDALIELAYFKTVSDCPANLYLGPYEDEADLPTLEKILAAGGPKSYMLYGVGERGGHDGAPFWGA